MASVFTTNIGIEQPASGDYNNAWAAPVNADWALIDQALGSSTTQAFTNANITLSVAQSAFFQVICTGILSGNVQLILPSAIGGRRVIQNNCTGAFTLKVLNGAGDTGGGIICGQGYQTPILLTAGRAYYDNTGNIRSGAATLASATTTDLGSVPQGALAITGTTTITSFGSSAALGESKILIFAGILTLTYNATSLILPGAANITTAVGDTVIATQISAGNWSVINYARASGVPVVQSFGVITGTIADFPATTAPSGFLALSGQLISRTTFAALFAFAQTSGNIVTDAVWTGGGHTGAFSTGDGSTTFRLPDARGYFLRSWSNGSSVDAGRGIGTTQADSVGPHSHTVPLGASALTPVGANSTALSQPTSGPTATTTQTPSGTTETRPVNFSVLTCIKT